MSPSTGARLDALVIEISAMNDLARNASLVIDQELKALDNAYHSILARRTDNDDRISIARGVVVDSTRAFQEQRYMSKLQHHDLDQDHEERCTIAAPIDDEEGPFTILAPTEDGEVEWSVAHEKTGSSKQYIQVIVDCDSLKWNLQVNKRGYVSGSMLIADLSDVINNHLWPEPLQDTPVQTPQHSDSPLSASTSKEQCESSHKDASDAGSSVAEQCKPFQDNSAVAGMFASDAGSENGLFSNVNNQVQKVPAKHTTATKFKKRFAFLIDPRKMTEKNYPLKRDKARTFIAWLDDHPGVELIHVGLGKKSVEERLKAHHPSVAKLTVMRSGGPFDKTLGIDSVAVDKFLSVQTQVPSRAGGGGSMTYARAGFEQRDRRSFAPSPQTTNSKKLTPTYEKNERGIASPSEQDWPGIPSSQPSLNIMSPSPFVSRYPDSALSIGALADKDTNHAENVSGGKGPESSNASSGDEMERWTSTPTPTSRLGTGSAVVLSDFEPHAVLRNFYKPLCAKYHLNNGICHCVTTDKALHDEVILKGTASKQLALWAANRVCPEGANCPEALDRKCCFWSHESVSAGSAATATNVSEEWISVDKKGKPIIPKHAPVSQVQAWQPSISDFNPLMTIIRQFTKDKHMRKHERGLIGTELKRAYGHDLYDRLGLAGFKQYTTEAENFGLVKLGYLGPSAGWIAAA
ncbi:hypothetical protein QFC19_008470 [Naganishia cerealis]|uniref:Uncharacterized protein n=1 Tax=Naganishia cerealis TaxID=610337 RepID=A0ACC2V1L1_9TREE|nr:hypothetical protein QFC19_008470 [Naganishia cerealis]